MDTMEVVVRRTIYQYQLVKLVFCFQTHLTFGREFTEAVEAKQVGK